MQLKLNPELTTKHTTHTRFGAPEFLKNHADGEVERVSRPGDVWAFGMTALTVRTQENPAPPIILITMIQIASGQVPFPTLGNSETWRVNPLIEGGGRPEAADYPIIAGEGSKFWELLQDCWQQEPEARPVMSQVVDRLSKLNEADIWARSWLDASVCRIQPASAQA